MPFHARPEGPTGPSALTGPQEGADAALGPYLRAVKARKVLVAVITLVVLGAAALLLSARSPTYETTAELLVTPLQQDDRTFLGLTLLRDSGDPTRTVQTAAALITSPAAARRTAEQLRGGAVQRDVEMAVSVEPLGESNIIGVTARAPSGAEAAELANRYAANAVALRAEALRAQVARAILRLEQLKATTRGGLSPDDEIRLTELNAVRDSGDPTLSLSQNAEPPSTATDTPARIVLILGLLAGLTLGTVVAVLAERFDRRIRDADELVALVPVPVLARIPTIRRDQRIGPDLHVPPVVREAFRTLQLELEQRTAETRRGSSTVVVTSASSEDGKTTTSICLALALASAGHEVVLVDWDLRRPDIGRRLGLDSTQGVGTLAMTLTPLDEVLQPLAAMPTLRVVTGDDHHTAPMPVLTRGLGDVLHAARAVADYVVVDTAPLGVVGDALVLAPFADELLLVGRAQHSDRRAVQDAVELLHRAGTSPTGWIVVGDDSGRRSDVAYYGLGEGTGRRRFGRRARPVG